MATTDFQPTPLSAVKARFDEAVYDPTLLVQAGLETLEEITNGEALLLDPTHPAVVILEMGAIEASNAVQATIGLLRKQYPILAEEESDLYRHMSDNDYVNRFASPSSVRITMAIMVSDIFSKLIRDESENCWKATISRDTRFNVDGVTFTLCYPIHIRRYQTGAIQIAYDTTISSPIQSVKEVVITPKVRNSANNEEWMFIEVDVIQVDRISFTAVIEQIYNYQKTIAFTDQFHFARAFYRNNDTANAWVELNTTHTDQVFDPRVPTVLFQVMDQELDARIPIIYFSNGSLTGELRIDIYTTKGELIMNLQNYTQDLFGVNMTPIDEERDYTPYVDTFSSISYYAFGTGITSGGKSAVDFETLRKRVIYNATGPQVLPITNVSVQADGENSSYNIVKDIDVVTNRVFLATRKLPAPTNPKLVTPANIGIVTYTGSLSDMMTSASIVKNGARYTMKSKALFQRSNGVLSLLSSDTVSWLRSLSQNQFIAEVNETEYLYTPFYYVLDETGNEFDMRAYSLDQPYAADLSFVRINQSLQLFVNTSSYSFEKISTGYKLTIQTNSGNYFKDAEDNHVGVQLAFNPYGETTYAYINGTYLGKTSGNERIYEFTIETNHDIDGDDLICITNARVQGVDGYKAWIKLDTTFNLLYHTSLATTNFEADTTDEILGRWLLPQGSVGNSHEELRITFGKSLSSLWRRARSYFNDTTYLRYESDIPKTYTEDTYEVDPVTNSTFTIVNGEIVYNVLHVAGDPVLNELGEQVYLHRKGDAVLDENGHPIKVISSMVGRELDLLVVDARYEFADDESTIQYLKEIESVLSSWVTVDMAAMGADLLEKTKIYFYPKTNIGEVVAYYEGDQEIRLNSDQEFNLTLYVNDGIFRNDSIRADIETRTTRLLDSYIDRATVNMSEIREQLRLLYGNSVTAFQISGLGGDSNYEMLTMQDGRYRLSLKKNLVMRADKKMYVKDAVNFEFKRSSI